MTAKTLLGPLLKRTDLPDTPITVLTENTAYANESSVFVCIKGARADGHALAIRAYEAGCRLFIAQSSLTLPADASVYYVPDTRQALAHLACTFYGHPSRAMRVIGITGTKGKTTTAQLLRAILNENGIPTGYIGTNGILYGDVRTSVGNTTPDAVTLQKTLLHMKNAAMQAVVVEVSSQALMQFRADGTSFEAVIFTNLYDDHVGPLEHPTHEHYKTCKKRLFTDFGAKSAIWNVDSDAYSDLRTGVSIQNEITVSTMNAADVCARNIESVYQNGTAGVSFTLCAKGESVPCLLPLMGHYNVSNALLAAAVASHTFGITPASIASALRDAAVEGRSEWLPLPSGAIAVIDYAHNGESLRQILTSLRDYSPARLICLFGSVGERSQLRRAELGQAANELADLCILTSDNPGREDPNAIIKEIAAGLHKAPYVAITDRAEAIRHALSIAQRGDILLLAGKGHENYQLIGTQKLPFSEKALIEDFCRKSASIH